MGICITCLSYSGSIRITGLADTGVLDLKGITTLVRYMEEAIGELSKVKTE